MKGMPPSTAKFSQMPDTKVFTEDGRQVQPGSGEVGMVAAGGNVPLGYFKDEEKTARTFRVIDGVRYSFPGDMATVNEDGSHQPARSRQPGHQHGRREGLPRRGGRGREARRRRAGLPRRRRGRRQVRPGRHRGGVTCGGLRRRRGHGDRRREDAAGRVQGTEARRVRRPRCRGLRTARPTTRPPSSTRSTRWPDRRRRRPARAGYCSFACRNSITVVTLASSRCSVSTLWSVR